MSHVYVAKGVKAWIEEEEKLFFDDLGKYISRKIYTFNFHRTTNPKDLIVFFSKFGQVQEACIRKCKKLSEKHDRFAFVIFKDICSAHKAIIAESSELELNGQILHVRCAESNTRLKKLPTTKRLKPRKKKIADSTESASIDVRASGRKNLGINDLNSSCLLQIFSYFTEREKLNLESVCQRWQRILCEQKKRQFLLCKKHLTVKKNINAKSTELTSVDGSRLEEVATAPGKRNLGINHLNNDCLFHIFSYFTIREKIRLELVCRRWHHVLLEQWKFTTRLNLKEINVPNLNDEILQGLLERCGSSLQRLSLPEFHSLRIRTVQKIASCCTNLKHLSIQNLALSSKDMECLASNCKNLNSLELKRPLCRKNQNFEHILQVLEKIPLKSFVFMQKRDNCKFLSSLPSTLKNLELISCDNLTDSYLLSGLSKTTTLQSFRISKVNPNLLSKGLFSKISNIEEFSATELKIQYFLQALPHFNQLHNLRKLSLKCSFIKVDDSVLAGISEGCKKLEILDISGCQRHHYMTGVSDLGIKALVNGCVLRELSISRCKGFTDNGLSILANAGKLRKLSCGYCANITDAGCSQLISLCLELELLNIEGCDKITSIVVASAISTLSLRSEKKTFHLYIKGTKILRREILNPDRSLVVHKEEYQKLCGLEVSHSLFFHFNILL